MWADGRSVAAVAVVVLGLWCATVAALLPRRAAQLGAWPLVGALPLALATWLRRPVAGQPELAVVLVDGRPSSPAGVPLSVVVSPSTWPPSSVASAVTGLHPLRHGVLLPGDRAIPGTRTVAAWVDAVLVDGDGCLVAAGLHRDFRVVLAPSWGGWEGLGALSLLPRRAPWTAAEVERAMAVAPAAGVLLVHAPDRVGVDAPAALWASLGGADAYADEAVAGTGRVWGVDGAAPVDVAVRVTDFAPTALALAGMKPGEELEGVDLLPWLRGAVQAPLATAVVSPADGAFAFRTADLVYEATGDGAERIRRLPDGVDLSAEAPETLVAARRVAATERLAWELRLRKGR